MPQNGEGIGMANKQPPSVTEARREIPRMLQTIRDRDYYSVVRDFFELSAISVRNTFDFTKRDEFEKRYMNVAKQYSRDQIETFASCLGLFMGEMRRQRTDPANSATLPEKSTWTPAQATERLGSSLRLTT
jgi:hypothetical protein